MTPERTPTWVVAIATAILVVGTGGVILASFASRVAPPEPAVPYSVLILEQCNMPLAVVVTYSNGGYEIIRPTDPMEVVLTLPTLVEMVPRERRSIRSLSSVEPCPGLF